MEAMAKIGECFWLATCLVVVFWILSNLKNLKFGIILRIAPPIFGFLVGICMGAYVVLLFSIPLAPVITLLFGVMGSFISFSISRQTDRR